MTELSKYLNSGKYALAIHTTTPELGLSISNFSGQERSHVWDLGRAMSTQLHVYLDEFLAPQRWSDLAFISVAKGPGGFTGTRIGVVTARTLAQQLNIPLFPVSTLIALAWAKRRTHRPESLNTITEPTIHPNIAIEMAARRGDMFGAIYSQTQSEASEILDLAWTLTPALSETVMAKEKWQETLDAWAKPYDLVRGEGSLGWTAPYLLELAYHQWLQGDRPSWSEALPYYGQSPV